MPIEINQRTARAMREVLRNVATKWRLGALSHEDMKLVWNVLDICAQEEDGLTVYPHQLALIEVEAVLREGAALTRNNHVHQAFAGVLNNISRHAAE